MPHDKQNQHDKKYHIAFSNKKNEATSTLAATELPASENSMLASTGETVILHTATVKISNENENIEKSVRIVLDTASHRTWITENLAKSLK